MRITDVRAVQPASPRCPDDWRSSMGQIVVAVDTDRGEHGYGVGGGGAAGVHVVRTVLRDLLLGRDPEPVEELWDAMYRATLPFGQKGLALMALSGVDLALWDLRARLARQPVAVCLGGSTGRSIAAYATLFAVDAAAPAIDAGFAILKVHRAALPHEASSERFCALVRRVRETAGPAVRLLADAYMTLDVPAAREVARELAGLGVEWLEEPLTPDDIEGYAELRGSSPIALAGGEHEYTARAFARWMERGLLDILQPDVTWCGGLTELVKIYGMAAARGLRVVPHRGAEPWGLHAIAALDPDPLAESGRPWLEWVRGAPAIRDGCVTLSDAPGFGVTVDESTLP